MAITAYSDVTGLALHYEAKEETGFVDDDAVGTLENQVSPGTNDATQAEAAKKPTYKTGVINGQPVIRFDGGDVLEIGDIDWTAYTWFFVLSFDAQAGQKTYFGRNQGYTAAISDSDKWAAGDGGTGRVDDTTTATAGQFYHVTVHHDGSTLTLYVDGTQVAQDATASISNNNNSVLIGAVDTSLTQAIDADIALILAYDSALSDADRNDVQDLIDENYFPFTPQVRMIA